MDDIYENIEEYTLNNKGKKLIVFYEIVADMFSNKTQSNITIVNICRKLNILLFLLHNLDFCTKKYQTKLYGSFYYENLKQTRASRNRIFIRY